MADGVTLNSGTGGPTIDTEACGSGGAHLQRVKMVLGARDTDGGDVSGTNPVPTASVGSAGFAVGQGSATTTAASAVAARTGAPGTGRTGLTLYNTSAVPMYIGASSSVTASNGKLVPAYSSITLPTQAAIFAITASGTASFDFVEFY